MRLRCSLGEAMGGTAGAAPAPADMPGISCGDPDDGGGSLRDVPQLRSPVPSPFNSTRTDSSLLLSRRAGSTGNPTRHVRSCRLQRGARTAGPAEVHDQGDSEGETEDASPRGDARAPGHSPAGVAPANGRVSFRRRRAGVSPSRHVRSFRSHRGAAWDMDGSEGERGAEEGAHMSSCGRGAAGAGLVVERYALSSGDSDDDESRATQPPPADRKRSPGRVSFRRRRAGASPLAHVRSFRSQTMWAGWDMGGSEGETEDASPRGGKARDLGQHGNSPEEMGPSKEHSSDWQGPEPAPADRKRSPGRVSFRRRRAGATREGGGGASPPSQVRSSTSQRGAATAERGECEDDAAAPPSGVQERRVEPKMQAHDWEALAASCIVEPSCTTSRAAVPYRRRKSAQALPLLHSTTDQLDPLHGETPATGGETPATSAGAPLFHELPPILITGVRYVVSESEAEATNQQEHFEYLSSEEDVDSSDDFEGRRSLMSMLRGQSSDSSSKTRGEKELGSKLALPCESSKVQQEEDWMTEAPETANEVPEISSARNLLAAASIDERYAFRPTCAGFREKFLALKKHEFAEDFWPEYYKDLDVAGMEARAQAALAVVVDTCACSRVSGECGLRERLLVDRFLANYFMDPDVFKADEDLRVRMVQGRYVACHVSQHPAPPCPLAPSSPGP